MLHILRDAHRMEGTDWRSGDGVDGVGGQGEVTQIRRTPLDRKEHNPGAERAGGRAVRWCQEEDGGAVRWVTADREYRGRQ
uniref:Uncharacterized protein n=1 Tax=Arundo donax TaxID=35708 RepID=A0A0A9AXZ6_ARUDO